MTSAAEIAHALGRAQKLPDGGWLIPCPVPSHGQGQGDRSPSLSIRDGDKGLLVHCFGGCAPRDVLDALRSRGLLDGEPVAHMRHTSKADDDERTQRERQRRKAAGLWAHRRPIKGSPAEVYLRSPGITCALPYATLGCLPARDEHSHSLIAAFGLHDEPEPGVLGLVQGLVDAVHLTRLAPDGTSKANIKSPKITIGSPRGRPIVLAPPNDLLGLAIAEGIEDALSIHQATGLGAWAAGSAPFLPALADAIPDYINSVTILVDHDKSGRDFSLSLAERLRARFAPDQLYLRELR